MFCTEDSWEMATGGGGTTGSFEQSFIPPFGALGCHRDSLTGNTTLPSRPETCYQAPALHPRPDLWAPLLHGSRNHLVRERLPSGTGTTALRGLSRGGSNGRGGSTLCGCVLPAAGGTGRLGCSPETSAAPQLWATCPAPRLLLRKKTPASALLTPACSPFSARPSLILKGKPDDPKAPHSHRSLCLSPCPWPWPLPALPASLLATRPCAALQGPRGPGASHFCSLNVAPQRGPP